MRVREAGVRGAAAERHVVRRKGRSGPNENTRSLAAVGCACPAARRGAAVNDRMCRGFERVMAVMILGAELSLCGCGENCNEIAIRQQAADYIIKLEP